MEFFTPFPQIQYDMNKDGEPIIATDIMLRFKIRDAVINQTVIMYQYDVQEGERPEIVADKYYGSPRYAELILLTNTIVDPYFEWPLSYYDFRRYIEKKYGSIAYATQNVHSYWRIVQARTELFDGTIVPERLLRIDKTSYKALNAEEKKIKYLYDYEVELNEKRRNIMLIDKTYISQIDREIKNIFS